MKFENPIMAISMFEVENIVTGSTGQGGQEPEKLDANAAAHAAINGQTYTVVF